MARHLRTTAIAAAAALLLIAAGCGGGSDSPGSTDLERATRDFAVNIFSGGEGAYDYLSQECRDQVPRAEWDTSLALVMAFVDGFTGGADAEDLIGDVETRSIGGGKGESRFDMVLPETVPEDVTITESQDWIAWKVEAGEWRLTDCEGALGGSSGNGGSDGDTGFDSGDDPSSVDFDGAPTEIEIALDDMFETPTSGTASVHLLETEDVESPIVSDSYSDQSATGKFVAVRYEVVNDTDAALHQFFDVVTAFDATDGETWFEITDGAASDALSIAREGEDSTADVEPGESATAWLVFDVPADAEVVGLGYRPGFFEVTAVALP